MKTSRTQIKSLYHNSYRPELSDYTILGREMVTRTVTHKIPFQTSRYNDGFPKYLRGFEEYYTLHTSRWSYDYYELKPEFEKCRPSYTYSVTYEEMEIELTEAGKEKVQNCINSLEKRLAKYARLLG
jgi:hypothetical protein